ncbi:MAG: hypothetical protein K2W93_14635 [Burkholderiaceae bacterium]|nr:hypothetical protein [Burkholderiaceae bacterium]
MSESRAVQILQTAIDDTILWLVFALIGGCGASMLALGLLLRSNQALTWRVVLGAVLHSIAWGFAVFLMAYNKLSSDLPFLVGLSIFSGMGTASFIDLMLLLVKQRMGISVTINPPSSIPPASNEGAQ